MKPDRSNYELWLIDWLDGKLDETGIRLLMDFLEENPDLKEEADSISLSRLEPNKNITVSKNILKKTVSELHSSQVEYLSIAYLEDDLSPDQKKDLEEKISRNEESRNLFDSIQKIRLKPPVEQFRFKRRLLKKTLAERIIRISLTGLSAAAAVTILIVTFLVLPRSLQTENDVLVVNSASDTILINKSIPIIADPVIEFSAQVPHLQEEKGVPENSFPEISETAYPQLAVYTSDTSSLIRGTPVISVPAIPELSGLSFGQDASKSVLASSMIKFQLPYDDPKRSRVSRFLASKFREKILKDNTYDDAPLQAYEVAEAGIEGLNKLLGWQMAFVKTNDENGEPQSFYFSSRVLKFNAPVKKAAPSL